MATYFWIGGATGGLSGSAYDWNYPKNWRKVTNLTTYYSVVPTTCPGPGDDVMIGAGESTNTALNNTFYKLRPQAPLLWGGFKPTSGLTSNGSWISGTTLGGTSTVTANGWTGALKSLTVNTGKNEAQIDVPVYTGNGYRFPMLGLNYVYRDPGMPQDMMAEDLFYNANYSVMGMTLISSWSINNWLSAIQNSQLSSSGITNGLYVKAENVNYITYPNPAVQVPDIGGFEGLNGADTTIHINLVDNFIGNTTPAGFIYGPWKYWCNFYANYNGGIIALNSAKLSNVYIDFNLGGAGVPAYKSTGTIQITNTKIAFMSANVWSDFYIDSDCSIGGASLQIYGPYAFGTDINSQTNMLGNMWLREPGDLTGKTNLIFDSKILLSGKYSPTVFNDFYTAGITVGSYNSGEYPLRAIIRGGKKTGTQYPNIGFGMPEFSIPGNLVLRGVTTEGIFLSSIEQPPVKFFTWSKENNGFECRNDNYESGPCSNGKLSDYIPDVYFAGPTFSASEVYLNAIDLNVATDWTGIKPVFTFGKMELHQSNLDFASQDTSAPDWRFGLIQSSASGVTLNGGLVLDKYSTLEGAESVRLLNYYVNPITKINSRTNKQVNEGIILNPPTPAPPVSGEA